MFNYLLDPEKEVSARISQVSKADFYVNCISITEHLVTNHCGKRAYNKGNRCYHMCNLSEKKLPTTSEAESIDDRVTRREL